MDALIEANLSALAHQRDRAEQALRLACETHAEELEIVRLENARLRAERDALRELLIRARGQLQWADLEGVAWAMLLEEMRKV